MTADAGGTSGSASRWHYAWVVALVTFVVLLVTAGIRATPGLLMVPLETEFGWSRAAISAAVALNIALFGLLGPFAASAMDRWGIRRLVLAALALLAISVGLTTQMRSQWQMTLLWGVCVGTGAGAIRTVAGDYRLAFWIAGGLCVLAGLSFLTIGRRAFGSSRLVPQLAGAAS